jgi:DNA-binding winged helix-turn-helix (wHTH) protein/tetratricopeptide (TPR) repeat protein
MDSYAGTSRTPPASDADAAQVRPIYSFGLFRLDPANRLLTAEGREVPLPGRAFDLLLCLVEHPGKLLTKEELLSAVWEGSFVEESNLTVAISTLRRGLNEDPQDRRYIQTVARRGYRFIAEVRTLDPALVAAPSPSHDSPVPVAEPIAAEPAAVPPAHIVPEPTPAPAKRPSPLHSWPLALLYLFLCAALAGGIWLLLKPRVQLHTLAVLPLTVSANASSGAPGEVELLGMTDALVQQLESQMIVRPTSAVLRYSAGSDPVAAGREQAVDAVLTGALATHSAGPRTGADAELQLRLVRVRDGLTLWQNHFSASTLSQLQAKAGNAVAKELHRLGAVAAPPATVPTDNPLARAGNPAYQLYLRGRYFWNLRTPDGLRKSVTCFRQAIDADPNFAPAYAGLADSYALLASFSVEPGSSANADARSAALSAIQLDPALAEPHASLGMILFFTDWNLPGAEREFEKSIQLNPNYATAHHWYALDLAAMGRFPQALYEVRLAQKLDPLSLIIGTNVGWIEYLSHDYPAATRDLHRVLELDPTFARARTRLGMVELTTGDFASAIQDLTLALNSGADRDPYVEGLLGNAQARSGDRATATHILDELRHRSQTSYVPPVSPALVLIGLKQTPEAIAELTKSVADHSTSMVYARVDPTLDPLRSDPAFQSLLSKSKL